MARLREIPLTLRRQADLQGGKPDYHIYAGSQLVGRAYQTHEVTREQWFWGITSLLLDSRIGGGPLHGYADDLDDAKRKLRDGFERWLAWALTTERSDPKRAPLVRQLTAIDVTLADQLCRRSDEQNTNAQIFAPRNGASPYHASGAR